MWKCHIGLLDIEFGGLEEVIAAHRNLGIKSLWTLFRAQVLRRSPKDHSLAYSDIEGSCRGASKKLTLSPQNNVVMEPKPGSVSKKRE